MPKKDKQASFFKPAHESGMNDEEKIGRTIEAVAFFSIYMINLFQMAKADLRLKTLRAAAKECAEEVMEILREERP